MYKDVSIVKTKFIMYDEAVSSLKCSLLFLDKRKSRISGVLWIFLHSKINLLILLYHIAV